jgi:glycosyltransferase involved in cell wall biosynthesis
VTSDRSAPGPDAGPAAPRISLVIPAWNEEAYLPRLLDSVDAARRMYVRGPDAVEVIVADNASTDGTARVAEERGCRVASVRRRRIAAARNGGADLARGEILCFVDADYRIHPMTFNAIDEAMSGPRYVGGATGCRMERMSVGIAATVLSILPMLWLTGVDGGVWFCRRDDFRAVGGYNEELPVSEDVRFLWALRRFGRRRRPRQKLARLSSWRSFWRTFRGLPPGAPPGTDGVRAVVSVRKFDRHGDWHFLRASLLIPATFLFAPLRFEAIVRKYWYEDPR